MEREHRYTHSSSPTLMNTKQMLSTQKFQIIQRGKNVKKERIDHY